MKMMRRGVSLLLSLALLGALLVVPAQAAPPMEEILGVYEGYYYAAQGQTGVTLSVYQENGQVKALFDFYNLPDRTNAKEGKFYMDVRYENGEYFFDATEWIERPSGYNTVDLQLTLHDYILSGKVYAHTGTYSFYAEKPNDAYEEVQDSIYGDHRYERVDQGMTWSQAQEYAVTHGGYLAVITSPGEQAFVEKLIAKGSKNQYWLGGHRDQGNFTWVNGESFGYTNWDTDEPDNHRGVEDCLQILRLPNPALPGSQAMKWNDAPNDNSIKGEEVFFSLSHVGFVVEYDAWSGSSDWATPELKEALENDLIPDVLIGKDLKGQITRGEFAAVAVKLYEAMSGNRTIIAMDNPFRDIDCAERLYILKAYNFAIVNGTGFDTYGPNDLISREQMATMLTRVVKKVAHPNYTIETDANYPLDTSGVNRFADDGDISDYAYAAVYFMAKNGIINGMGNNLFAPKNTTSAQAAAFYANATREQALLTSVRSLNNLK